MLGTFGLFVIAISLLAPISFGASPENHSHGLRIAHVEAAAPQNLKNAGVSDTCYDSGGTNCTQQELDAWQNALIGTGAKNIAGRTPQAPAAQNAGECSWSPSTWNICFANVIYIFTVGLGSSMAYIASIILNTVIMLALNSTAYALQFLTDGWVVVRDAANMLFLFILIYIAFSIMFRSESGGTIQTLAWVLIMAVLINFSFFLTRVVIDAGNIAAVQVYNAMPSVPIKNAAAAGGNQTGGVTNGCLSFFQSLCKNSKDLTAIIMNSIQLQNIFNPQYFASFQGSGSWVAVLISLSLVYIVMGIMFFMLMGAFLYAAVMFMARIVTLWFLIIASPLAFAARAIPIEKFRGYYYQWQSLLISNTFYPVLFLFIFLILSKIMQSIGQTTLVGANLNQGSDTGFLNTVASIVGYVGIKLGLVLGVLFLGLSAAKKVSGGMGESSIKLGNMLSGWAEGKVKGVALQAPGRAAGVAAWTGRTTAGLAGQRAFESNWLRNRAAQGGLLSRTAWRAARGLGQASFDVRNVPIVGSGAASGKGGYRAAYDARVKRREEEAEALKPSKGKVEQAEHKVLNALPTSDREELATLAENYTDAIKDNKELNTPDTRNALKNARKAYNDKFKGLGIADKVKEMRGKGNAGTYADSITTRSWRNLWRFHSVGFVTQASYEASARLRKAESEEESNPKAGASRIRSLLDSTKKYGGSAPPPSPPPGPPPHGPGPTPAPAPGASPRTREATARTQQEVGSLNTATERLIKGIERAGERMEGQRAGGSKPWQTPPVVRLDDASRRTIQDLGSQIRKFSRGRGDRSAGGGSRPPSAPETLPPNSPPRSDDSDNGTV